MATVLRQDAVPADIDQDLGFGGRVAQKSRERLLNRDGTFNVERTGLPLLRTLNFYHALLTISWTKFYLFVAAAYFLVNLAFAAAYFWCGPRALAGSSAVMRVERFEEAFFFSVQTLATIGYGRLSPAGHLANILVTLEALLGLLGFALATGLLFARFSRPQARILFSEVAVVAPYRGFTGLMFRIANERTSQLMEVEAVVTLSRLETVNGQRTRRFHELALERKKVIFFPLHWVVVHPIDESSPLFGVDQESLAASDAEILIYLTAFDETFSQTVHARSSYKFGEVICNARFVDIFLERANGIRGADLSRLSAIERL